MANFFKNKLVAGLGTDDSTPVLTTDSTARTTIIGLSLTNMTESIVLASIKLVDTDTSTEAFYIKEIIVPANQSLRVINGGERLILGVDTEVYVFSNTASSLDLVLSYVEIL
jgi:hypothetical protein